MIVTFRIETYPDEASEKSGIPANVYSVLVGRARGMTDEEMGKLIERIAHGIKLRLKSIYGLIPPLEQPNEEGRDDERMDQGDCSIR